MTNFVKFSDVKKRRSHLEQLARNFMEDAKAGINQIVCPQNTLICPYIRTCPNAYLCNPVSLYAVPMYGVPDDYAIDNNAK